jgi:hypothetical protein
MSLRKVAREAFDSLWLLTRSPQPRSVRSGGLVETEVLLVGIPACPNARGLNAPPTIARVLFVEDRSR